MDNSLSDTSSNVSTEEVAKNDLDIARDALRRQPSSSKDLVYDSGPEDGQTDKLLSRRQIHQVSTSLLSSVSKEKSYRGFVNLCILTLVLSNLREVVYNFQKYGVMINLSSIWDVAAKPDEWPMALLLAASNLIIVSVWAIEWFSSKHLYINKQAIRNPATTPVKKTPEEHLRMEKVAKKKTDFTSGSGLRTWFDTTSLVLHAVLLVIAVALPPIFVYQTKPILGSSMLVTCIYVCLFMKLVSYVVVNRSEREKFAKQIGRDARRAAPDMYAAVTTAQVEAAKVKLLKRQSLSTITHWPHNLTLRNIYYFILAPTLTYEPYFPRSTGGIKWVWMFRRILELCLLLLLEITMIQQYITPLCSNAFNPMKEGDWIKMVERLLKLSIPNLLVWLIGFYMIFQTFLNILGELLSFGDRLFYLDWWNATTIDYFWRSWNIPVHRWMLVHIYMPLLNKKVSRDISSFLVFVVSAFLHEYVVAVCFMTLKWWAFSGMIMQVPLSMITKRYMKDKQLGNVIFWISIMLGQPFCVLMYYFDYRLKNG